MRPTVDGVDNRHDVRREVREFLTTRRALEPVPGGWDGHRVDAPQLDDTERAHAHLGGLQVAGGPVVEDRVADDVVTGLFGGEVAAGRPMTAATSSSKSRGRRYVRRRPGVAPTSPVIHEYLTSHEPGQVRHIG